MLLEINKQKQQLFEIEDSTSCEVLDSNCNNSNNSGITCTINVQSSPQMSDDLNDDNSNNTTITNINNSSSETTIINDDNDSESSESSERDKLVLVPKTTTAATIEITTTASISCSSSNSSEIDNYIASLGLKDDDQNIGDSSTESESIDEHIKHNEIDNGKQQEPTIEERINIEQHEEKTIEIEKEVEGESKQPSTINTSTASPPTTTNTTTTTATTPNTTTPTNNINTTTPITSRSSSISSVSSSLSSSSLLSAVSDSSQQSLTSSINSSVERNSPMYQRKRALEEMLKVERGYVQDMTTLIDVFKKPFSEDNIFPKQYLFTLFCNIEELKDLHQQFLNDIEKKFEPTNGKPADLNIGDLFLPFMGSFQKLYEVYINNYEKAFALTRYFKINPNYQDIQKSIYQKEKDQRCRHLDFGSFLVIPIQRLPRYIVLLKEMEKHTPTDNPDFNFIALSLVQLQDLTLYLNESKRKSSNSDKIDEVKQSVFGATAIIGQSKYIMEGQLSLLKGVVASTKKDLFIYLFKDCIICTEINSNYQKDGSSNSNNNSSNNLGNSSNNSSPNNLTPKKQTFKSLSTSSSTPNNLSQSSLSPNNTLTHSISGGNGTPLSTQLNNSSNSNIFYQRVIFKSIAFSDVKAISALKNFKDSFQVVTSKKVYTFVAPNTDNRDKWVSVLNDLQQQLTPPPSPTLSRSNRFTGSLSPTLKRKNRNSVQLSQPNNNNSTPQQL
ncbi:hypothetical protein RB653_007717 [Dictyostelium firmibasis]|uniref:Pleckstrin domain-containing protein n=1 Tax=Dictyostelium firmibasis TaxID=79012 RepID=A0AAN7U4Q7_9MYCE